MSGIVQLKFKHQTNLDKIEFAGTEISVAELKIKIAEKLMLLEKFHKNASAIQLCRIGGSSEIYEFDHELIPTHTCVIVMRVPKSSAASNRTIVVEQSSLFAHSSLEEADAAFKLRPSVIQADLEEQKPVPDLAVCQICSWVMCKDWPNRAPLTLSCCGVTVCAHCFGSRGDNARLCPVEKTEKPKAVLGVRNRAIDRFIAVVLSERNSFRFDAVHVDPTFEQAQQGQAGLEGSSSLGPNDEEEVVDVDSFTQEVLDVDDPRPLTAKEREQIERRERRKRKAAEILLKREGKAVKGELTESDVNKILKMELKAEGSNVADFFASGSVDGGDTGSGGDKRAVVVEFPRFLSPMEFEIWKRSVSLNSV